MPLFRRRKEPPTSSAAPAAARGRGTRTVSTEPDWRSYDGVAVAYARVHAPRTAKPATDLVEMLGVDGGRRALDVATGTGAAARVLAAAGAETVGIDRSLPMLRVAVAEGGGPTYAGANAIDLPFRNGSFEVVTSCFALSHFTRYETALFDMLRVLARGGRIGVTSWGPSRDEFSVVWTAIAEEFGTRELLRDAHRRAMPWSETLESHTKLRDVLYDAGAREIRLERREYRFPMTAEDYLEARETASTGRALHDLLGDTLWERFRERTRAEFAERFPSTFNDFREVNLAVGTKP